VPINEQVVTVHDEEVAPPPLAMDDTLGFDGLRGQIAERLHALVSRQEYHETYDDHRGDGASARFYR
jgi:hypothetical protein